VLICCWINDTKLYIEHEAYEIGCDIDKTPELFAQIPGSASHTIRADSARPETISYMQGHGYPLIEAVSKWTGSVEDGVQFMRSFEQIVVHPRCTHAAQEIRLYSFKIDRLSGDVLPIIIDKANHAVDSIRYSLQPMIMGNRGPGAFLSCWREIRSASKRRLRSSRS